MRKIRNLQSACIQGNAQPRFILLLPPSLLAGKFKTEFLTVSGQIQDWAKPVPSKEWPKKSDENISVYRSLFMTMSLNDRLTFNLSKYDHDLTGFRHEFVP